MYKLAIDAMGSDRGSSIVLESSLKFVSDYEDVELYVYGAKDELKALANHNRIHIVETTQVMEMTDGALATRRKADSSMVRAITDLQNKVVDGVVSCGSTGALLSASTLLLGTITGIERAALLMILPTKSKRGVVLVDCGANASCTSLQLTTFAVLGNAYAKIVNKLDLPKIGLLNVGSEDKKGDELRRETFSALKELSDLNFIGNIEGKDVLTTQVDVVVTDGFTGNVFLKSVEGAADFMMSSLKENLTSSSLAKIGAVLAKNSLKKMKIELDPNQYGGALIAGLNGAVVKGHGSSNEEAFYHALRQLYSIVKSDVVNKLKEELQ
jgi:fatty acid/phospholipid synthesis protein PlsX